MGEYGWQVGETWTAPQMGEALPGIQENMPEGSVMTVCRAS